MIENERDSITMFSTGCPILDKTFNGGIRLGQITELYGESGCGKTQLCIQLSLEVQRTFRARGQEASQFFFTFHFYIYLFEQKWSILIQNLKLKRSIND